MTDEAQKLCHFCDTTENDIDKGYSAEYLINTLDTISEINREFLAGLTDADLDKFHPANDVDPPRESSLRWMLQLSIDHEGHHRGQIAMIKRLIRGGEMGSKSRRDYHPVSRSGCHPSWKEGSFVRAQNVDLFYPRCFIVYSYSQIPNSSIKFMIKEIYTKFIAYYMLATFVLGAAPARFCAKDECSRGRAEVYRRLHGHVVEVALRIRAGRMAFEHDDNRGRRYKRQGDNSRAEKLAAYTGSKVVIDARPRF